MEDIKKKINAKEVNSLALAYIGDSVFDLLVKKNLILHGNLNPKKLHKKATDEVCCTAQSHSIDTILDCLTAEELAVYKRGRNAHVSHLPKNSTPEHYHKATGLEALFGYLYLDENLERIYELFDELERRSTEVL